MDAVLDEYFAPSAGIPAESPGTSEQEDLQLWEQLERKSVPSTEASAASHILVVLPATEVAAQSATSDGAEPSQ